MIKLAAISNSYAEYSVHCLRMSEAEKAEFRPLGYAETNTLGKTQNNSDKTKTFNHPILNVLHKQQGLQRCLDRTIIAVIEYQGKIYIGTNGIINVPTECPRSGCTINQGYELCRTVCHQPYHAEESAIVEWLIDCGNVDKHDATISVFGAKAMCERCKALCEHHKLRVVKVTPDLMGFLADLTKG